MNGGTNLLNQLSSAACGGRVPILTGSACVPARQEVGCRRSDFVYEPRTPYHAQSTRDAAASKTAVGAARQPKLLDRVREALRSRHDSPRTEQTYVQWIRQSIRFHNLSDPAGMGEDEINAFLIKRATCHSFRHSFITHLLEAGSLPRRQTGIYGPCRSCSGTSCEDDDDLHARSQSRWKRRTLSHGRIGEDFGNV
jgi:hypothetical protein